MPKSIGWMIALKPFLALSSPALIKKDEVSEGKSLDAAKKWLTLLDPAT